MKTKLHFTVAENEDFVVVEADTIEGIREKAKTFMKIRGFSVEKNNLWSEQL